jgi:hypothetical protein
MSSIKGLPIESLCEKFQIAPDKKKAWKIINEFYDFFDKDGMEEAIQDLLTCYLKSDSEDIDGKDRGNMLYFCEYMKGLNHAVYFLKAGRHYEK